MPAKAGILGADPGMRHLDFLLPVCEGIGRALSHLAPPCGERSEFARLSAESG